MILNKLNDVRGLLPTIIEEKGGLVNVSATTNI